MKLSQWHGHSCSFYAPQSNAYVKFVIKVFHLGLWHSVLNRISLQNEKVNHVQGFCRFYSSAYYLYSQFYQLGFTRYRHFWEKHIPAIMSKMFWEDSFLYHLLEKRNDEAEELLKVMYRDKGPCRPCLDLVGCLL